MRASHSTPSRPSAVPDRRTLLSAAAWATPAIAVTSAAPAFASSHGTCEEVTVVEAFVGQPSTANLTDHYAAATETFLVPADVTSITFEVAGGGGGVNRNYTGTTISHPGGDGDMVSGVLEVVPGTALTLVAGNGGIGPMDTGVDTPANSTIMGGSGYGRGGNLKIASAKYRYAGGSGGGGSAILVGEEPIVVAGGGGGSGGGTPGGDFEWTLDAGGGSGGLNAASGTLAAGRWTQIETSEYVYSADGGGGASDENPGTGANGDGGVRDWGPDPTDPTSHSFSQVYGTNGFSLATGEGGHGADGSRAEERSGYQYTSGAGGGGYAGGASGDALTTRGAESQFAASMGGGGGGGSSYVHTSTVDGTSVVSSSHTPAGNGAHPALQRNPGWIKLTYEVC